MKMVPRACSCFWQVALTFDGSATSSSTGSMSFVRSPFPYYTRRAFRYFSRVRHFCFLILVPITRNDMSFSSSIFTTKHQANFKKFSQKHPHENKKSLIEKVFFIKIRQNFRKQTFIELFKRVRYQRNTIKNSSVIITVFNSFNHNVLLVFWQY